MTESDDSRVGRAMTKPLSERLEKLATELHAGCWDNDVVTCREAAALARRVEGAAVGRIEDGGHCIAVNPSDGDSFIAASKMIGQRVRLVPEVGS